MSDVWLWTCDVRCLIQASDVRRLMYNGRRLMSDVSCQTSDVCCRMSDVWCLMSAVSYQIPTLSLGGRRHRGRWLWLRQLGEGRRRLCERNKLKFQWRWRSKVVLNFIEGLRISSLKKIRELLVYFYNNMMESYQMRNSFPCTMKSSWPLCCSKVNVCRSIEPFCDLRIAKFSHAAQFLRLVIEPT